MFNGVTEKLARCISDALRLQEAFYLHWHEQWLPLSEACMGHNHSP